MPKVIFIAADGTRTELEVPVGVSLMQAAVDNNVEGIIGECGGSAMCATCHVYIEEADSAKLDAMSDVEDAMLDSAACPRQATSRLGCQIVMTEALDGLVVHLPERQV